MILMKALGDEKLSLKELMTRAGNSHRPTFLENYITPGIRQGFLQKLYPDSPNHPRQKYFLTVKGLMLKEENELTQSDSAAAIQE